MKNNIIILLLFLWISNLGYSQTSVCYHCVTEDGEFLELYSEENDLFVRDTVRDTIYLYLNSIDSVLINLDMNFNDFVYDFLEFVKTKRNDSIYFVKNEKYLGKFMHYVNEYAKHYRYIVYKYWADYPTDRFFLHKEGAIIPTNIPDSLTLEYLFVLEGTNNTNNFLNTHFEQVQVLQRILKDINHYKLEHPLKRNPLVINFCFPDFSFKEKRAMYQFIKSVSLVLDSLEKPSMKDVLLYFTFNESAFEEHKSYILGMYDMVDSIYLIKDVFNMDFKLVDINTPTSKFSKILSQFYFARVHTEDLPSTKSDTLDYDTISELMQADYPDSWEQYLLGIIGSVLLLIIGILLYLLFAPFANYVHENYMYVFAGVLIIVTEIILLFVFMIEEMTNKSNVFSLWEILLFQILLIFVIPFIKKSVGRKTTP